MTARFDDQAVTAIVFSAQRCLERRGITPPSMQPSDSIGTYWRRATALAGEDLALQVAAEMPIGAFGLSSYSIATAPTLAEALHAGQTLIRRVIPQISCDLRVSGGRGEYAEIEIAYADNVCGPIIEELILAVLQRYGVLLTVPTKVSRVRLRRPRPRNSSPWERTFGLEPSFDQEVSALEFDAPALNGPLRTASAPIHQFVASIENTALRDRVRALLTTHLKGATETNVAAALGLTRRTLQRRLHDEGTSLRDVLAEARIDAACDLLAHTSLSIATIAQRVGFRRASSLSRAFKLAKRKTAQQFRADQKRLQRS